MKEWDALLVGLWSVLVKFTPEELKVLERACKRGQTLVPRELLEKLDSFDLGVLAFWLSEENFRESLEEQISDQYLSKLH
ncbi:MAG: hypothetical protein Q8P35_00140 [Candidatus Yanofskybacteria bacterium]|nr:hypothetical protein [Candidatus Yanofskybacteria bacterium]